MLETATGIYLRVSTEDQAKEGFSIKAQKEKLTKYAELHDWDIYDYYIDDGISGKNIKDREQINRLLKDVESGKIKNVLVYKLDRLTRSVADLINLINIFEKHDCSFNSHTEKLDTSNAVGRMFIKIVGIFAEFERENLAERITFGYEQKTREGNYTNTNGVYGYNYIIGKGLEVDEEEKKIVNDIYKNYLNGTSMTTISKLLNENQVPTKRGGKWWQATIKIILTNPLYIGKVRYAVLNKLKSFTVKGKNIEPIIDSKLWYDVQEMMKKRKKNIRRKFSNDDTYFFPSLRCGVCGSKYHARHHVHSEKKYISYACNGRRNGTCKALGFSHAKLEKSFLSYLDNIENFNTYKQIELESKEAVDIKDIKEDKEQVNKELRKIEAKKNQARNLFLNDAIAPEEYHIMLKKLNDKKETLTKETTSLEASEKKVIKYKDVINIVNNIKLNWQHLTNKERKNFLERFVQAIKVKKEEKEVQIKEIIFEKM